MASVYLVGGYLRDEILGKTTPDRDLVVFGETSYNYSLTLGGRVVLLDEENQIYRVVMEDKTYFDVTQAESLENDAKRRDFTINSIYKNLDTNEIYDPYNGVEDIKNKIIRTVDLKNLDDDPLRMLRAFRFSSILGFKIEENILSYISKNYSKINSVSPERIQYELLKMFEGDDIVNALKLMDSVGLLEEIFPFVKEVKKIPPNTHHHLPLIEHLFETINNLTINDPLLRLAAFMHDIGKPKTWTIEENGRHRFIGHDSVGAELACQELKRLKFSHRQIEFVSKMTKYHIYPSSLMCQEDRSDKALVRFVKKMEPYVKEVIDLARADRLSARGVLITDEIVENNLSNLQALLNFYEKIKPTLVNLEKLLDGKEIMVILNIKPSKKLGEIIEQLNEAQLLGDVKTKDEAIEFVKNLKI